MIPTLPHQKPPPRPPRPPLQIIQKIHIILSKQVLLSFFFILFILFTFIVCIILQKEVFLWVDSELKDVYQIDNELTWAEQKEEIVTKLLPPLYKIVEKKYNITNSKLLKMLYGRWRSRHRVNNIRKQGDERIKQDKRRSGKNSRMQDINK